MPGGSTRADELGDDRHDGSITILLREQYTDQVEPVVVGNTAVRMLNVVPFDRRLGVLFPLI